MISIEEAKKAVVEDFSMLGEWLDKYEYLIELGNKSEPFPEALKTDDRLIKGCQSRVWLDSSFQDGKLLFKADSDAIITKGIIAILIRAFSNHQPAEILEADTQFIDAIGLKDQLSPTRANGLVSMVKQIKMYALAFSTKN